jgi:hypothetical protein
VWSVHIPTALPANEVTHLTGGWVEATAGLKKKIPAPTATNDDGCYYYYYY